MTVKADSILFTFQFDNPTYDITTAVLNNFGGGWNLMLRLWIGLDGWHATVPVEIRFEDADGAVEALHDIYELGLELLFVNDDGPIATLEDGNAYMGRPVVQV